MPTPLVRNILPALRRDGIITSLRDVPGGYRLATPLRAISVLDVLVAIDRPVALDEDDLPAGLTPDSVRTIRRALDGVAGDVAARLRRLKLAQLTVFASAPPRSISVRPARRKAGPH